MDMNKLSPLKNWIVAVGVLAASTIAAVTPAQASVVILASLFSPIAPSGATLVPIVVSGIVTPSLAPIVGTGYSIAFAVAPGQGVVNGTSFLHAVPVAGVSGTSPLYLTGDFGSALTPSIASSGNYLSTGTGTITITFVVPQSAIALLWGSIDPSNAVTFNDAAGDVVTGTQIAAAAAGFVGNGFQGPGGSAYVALSTNTTFTTVTFSSSVVSYELAGIIASNRPFVVPEPAPMALVGLGLGALVLSRRRKLSI